ncbi:MAG: RNA-binding protein [Euryarchaeota archaeon]|nr:RNA-binding protein [Euryarchaeota archaeon]
MVMPHNVLERSLNKRVNLLLKDSRVLDGKLVSFDENMNMVLEETEETAPDQSKRRLGTVVLRGNNVVTISFKN